MNAITGFLVLVSAVVLARVAVARCLPWTHTYGLPRAIDGVVTHQCMSCGIVHRSSLRMEERAR